MLAWCHARCITADVSESVERGARAHFTGKENYRLPTHPSIYAPNQSIHPFTHHLSIHSCPPTAISLCLSFYLCIQHEAGWKTWIGAAKAGEAGLASARGGLGKETHKLLGVQETFISSGDSRCERPGTCLRGHDVMGRSRVRGSSWNTSGAACGTL